MRGGGGAVCLLTKQSACLHCWSASSSLCSGIQFLGCSKHFFLEFLVGVFSGYSCFMCGDGGGSCNYSCGSCSSSFSFSVSFHSSFSSFHIIINIIHLIILIIVIAIILFPTLAHHCYCHHMIIMTIIMGIIILITSIVSLLLMFCIPSCYAFERFASVVYSMSVSPFQALVNGLQEFASPLYLSSLCVRFNPYE